MVNCEIKWMIVQTEILDLIGPEVVVVRPHRSEFVLEEDEEVDLVVEVGSTERQRIYN